MKFKNWPRDQDPHLFRLMVVNLCLYSQRRYWTGSGRVSIVVLTDSYRPLRSQEWQTIFISSCDIEAI